MLNEIGCVAKRAPGCCVDSCENAQLAFEVGYRNQLAFEVGSKSYLPCLKLEFGLAWFSGMHRDSEHSTEAENYDEGYACEGSHVL